MRVQVAKDVNTLLPEYAKPGDAGADVRANITIALTVSPGESVMVPTGLKVAIPEGYEIQVRPRSGLAAKYGITVLNSPGTLDAGFRGEIHVVLINHGKLDFIISPKMRIGQLVMNKFETIEWDEVDKLPESERGSGGFGHTGH